MKLISFEGIDASGKETQAKMLYKYLLSEGFNVAYESFPRYYTQVGELIKKSLKGEITLTPEAHHMLYEVDRIDFMGYLNELEKHGCDFLILDRYTHSNIAYGVANNLSYIWLKLLQAYVRKPDLVFLLDITVEESIKRRENRQDLFENDLKFLYKVRMAYTLLAKTDPTIISLWVGGSTPEQIHEAILYHLKGKGIIK